MPSTWTSFTNSCVSPLARSIRSGVKGRASSSTLRTRVSVRSPLANPEHVLEPTLIQGRDGRFCNHAPIRHDAGARDPEAMAQAIDDGHKHAHIRGIARHHLGADRASFGVDYRGQDHLLQVGPMILGVAVSA